MSNIRQISSWLLKSGEAYFRIHWNFVYWGTGLSYTRIAVIYVLEFRILKNWTFVYGWFVHWNFVYWSTGLLYMPELSTGISYIQTLDFRILEKEQKLQYWPWCKDWNFVYLPTRLWYTQGSMFHFLFFFISLFDHFHMWQNEAKKSEALLLHSWNALKSAMKTIKSGVNWKIFSSNLTQRTYKWLQKMQ